MDSLPLDVRDKIFLTFTINTLLMCTCVSKSWLSYLRSSRFITLHRQRQRRDLLIMQTCTHIFGADREIYTLLIDNDTFPSYATFHCPFPISGTDTRRLLGSCNGVVCILADYGLDNIATYLWNPTILRCHRLPPPRITFETHGEFYDTFGFGFDPNTIDYKVVRIVELPYRHNGFPLEVEVYSHVTGNWRNISDLASDIQYKFCYRHRTKAPQVHLDGVIYWFCLNWRYTNCMIIAFDLGGEAFISIEAPIMLSYEYLENVEINVIKESVCLIQRCMSRACVWVMKGELGEVEWEKILDCDLFSQVDRLIGFTIDGKLLLQITGGLYCYDVEAADGRAPHVFNNNSRICIELFQEGRISALPAFITSIDPKVLPRELEIHGGRFRNTILSFRSMGYIESLALL